MGFSENKEELEFLMFKIFREWLANKKKLYCESFSLIKYFKMVFYTVGKTT